MINNFFRIINLAIYPTLLFLIFVFIYKNKLYRKTIINNWKTIVINTIIISVILLLAITLFFKIEDTIYVYDFSGHWIRSLELRQLLYDNPSSILHTVYNSMNYDDYSYLPSLFNLWSMVFGVSYGYFCVASFINFFIPFVVLAQILYFSYFDKYRSLPILICLSLYPLYFTLFNGEIDLGGMIFVLSAIMLTIVPSFKEIDLLDNLFINILGFTMIFYRRWYLYSLVAIYVCYFIKFLYFHRKEILSQKCFMNFCGIVSSGLIMLIVVIVFFRPFLMNALFNNYTEAYSYYDRGGKLISLINYLSPIILLISVFGIYKLWKLNKQKTILFLIAIILPTAMFWRIQSFERHHYYIILVYVLFLFSVGLYFVFDYKHLKYLISIILLSQTFVVFSKAPSIPLFTNTRKIPEVLSYKQDVVDFTYYLNTIITEDWQSAYLASSSAVLSDDMIRNSILPDLNKPQIDSAVLDLRDGFPRDMQYIQYVITIDPIQYLDPEYQHIYSVISNAIWNEPLVSNIYTPIYKTSIADLNVCVYEKTGEYSKEIKEYFYNEILKYYPNKEDFFSYILD